VGSIGVPELIMIFIVALVLFGPKKLPEIGRTIGKAMAEFRRATNDLQRSLEEEVGASELRQVHRDVREIGQSLKKAVGIEAGLLGGMPAAAPVKSDQHEETAPAAAAEEGTQSPDGAQPKPVEPR
jgi:sec-independent protein translocase protein TatA